MRHRGRNGTDDVLQMKDTDSNFVSSTSTQRKNQIHSALHRFFASVCSFILFLLVVSIPNVEEEANNTKGLNNIIGPPSFVTVVLPSVVNPDNRPLRLESIAKTWGQASRSIFVLHNTEEYPGGVQIGEQTRDAAFPQSCLVPEAIKFNDGVPRLEYVIREVYTTIDPDFAFFVNDHTFVLPKHLHQFLKLFDSSEDSVYAGHALKGEKETAFNSGASGYVLSRITMRRLINEWDKPNSKCSGKNASKWLQGNPGLLTAQCFQEVMGIQLLDTRDEDNSHKFHAFGLVRTITGNVDQWYLNKHQHLDSIFGLDERYHHIPQKGSLCCSKDTISFHYVEAAENIAFWNILQQVQEVNMSDEQIKERMIQKWPRRPEIGAYSHPLPESQSPVWRELIEVIRKISSGVRS